MRHCRSHLGSPTAEVSKAGEEELGEGEVPEKSVRKGGNSGAQVSREWRNGHLRRMLLS